MMYLAFIWYEEDAAQMYNFAAYRLCGEYAKYNEAEQTYGGAQ